MSKLGSNDVVKATWPIRLPCICWTENQRAFSTTSKRPGRLAEQTRHGAQMEMTQEESEEWERLREEIARRRHTYEFSDKSLKDEVSFYRARWRRRSGLYHVFLECTRGYGLNTARLSVTALLYGLIIGPAAFIFIDHATAGETIHSFFSGLWKGPLAALALVLYMSVPVIVVKNGRTATLPLWTCSFAVPLFVLAMGGYSYFADVDRPHGWYFMGIVAGAVGGIVGSISARASPSDISKMTENLGDDKKLGSAAITVVLSDIGVLGGPLIGSIVGLIWATFIVLLSFMHIGPAYDIYLLSTSTLFSLWAFGTFVGFACSALLTRGERFFRPWSKERLIAEGVIIGSDGKAWNGKDCNQIGEINFQGKEIRPRDFHFFYNDSCSNLRKISASGCAIGDDWMAYFNPVLALESLDLSDTGGRGMWISETALNLKGILISGTKFGSRFELLGLYPSLERIWMHLPGGDPIDQKRFPTGRTNVPKDSLWSVRRQRPDINIH